MNLFSAKSIGLYSLAIGSAIVFFQVVTSYGEANIKAPISIAGDYLINAQNAQPTNRDPPITTSTSIKIVTTVFIRL